MMGCIETDWPRYHGTYGARKIGGVSWRAHRWAWTQANGPIPDGMHVLHRCDNPPCVNVDHLWLGTNADNVADMIAKGRHHSSKGDLNPNRKLSSQDIPVIRGLLAEGKSQSYVASLFGVKQVAVSRIFRRVSWAHV